MSIVKRNIVANLTGGALLIALTVIITPLQINMLGLASYGIVGFISTLQIAFTAFDLGLSNTITREIAIDKTKNKQGSSRLLQTASTIYWIIAAFIGTVIVAFSNEIAHRWFTSHTIDVQTIKHSLQVIALYLALRWPVSLYTSVLIGLQRMEVLNIVKVATASVRQIGGVFVLLQWRSLNAFLIWIAISALIEVVSFWLTCRSVYPALPWRPGISIPDLRRVWRFSLTLTGLSVMTVLVVNADRLMISKLQPLEALGAYTLAYSAASIIPAMIGAISTAVLPYFAEAYGADDSEMLAKRYDTASRIMMFLVGLLTGCFVFFGDHLLALWVNPEAAAAAAMSLALLSIGFFGSGAASNAYQITVASKKATLTLRISLLTAVPYLVMLYVFILWLGINGAALAWLLLNVGYILLLVPRVHREILRIPVVPYLLKIFIPFVVLVGFTFGIARSTLGDNQLISPLGVLIVTCLLGVYLLLGFFLLGEELRMSIFATLRRLNMAVWCATTSEPTKRLPLKQK